MAMSTKALDYFRATESRARLAEEKFELESKPDTEHDFEEIIGHSSALKSLLRQVEIVAPTDSTVLIQGETGKELVARAIHRLNARHSGPFVKVNCSAIPSGLLESELFGHCQKRGNQSSVRGASHDRVSSGSAPISTIYVGGDI